MRAARSDGFGTIPSDESTSSMNAEGTRAESFFMVNLRSDGFSGPFAHAAVACA